MSDPIAELIAEDEAERNGEREERQIVLRRLTELLDKIDALQAAEDQEQVSRPDITRGFTIRVTERDENGQISAIRVMV